MSVKSSIGVVTDGLVFYVDAGNGNSYPGTGTDFTDLVGSNEGGLRNMESTDFVSDDGGYLNLGGSDEKIDFGDFDNTKVSSSITVSVWFKDLSGSGYPHVFGNGGGWGAGGFVMFAYNNGIRFELQGTGKEALDISGISYTGSWQNVVGTWEQGQNIKSYVNGSFINQTSGITSIGTNSDTGNLSAGGKGDGSEMSTAFGLMKFASASIYGKALSASEVLQNYNALKNRFI